VDNFLLFTEAQRLQNLDCETADQRQTNALEIIGAQEFVQIQRKQLE
jgi:hypothetical protein